MIHLFLAREADSGVIATCEIKTYIYIPIELIN